MAQTYQPLELSRLLNALRSAQFSGTVCCRSSQPAGAGSAAIAECFLIFQQGHITYVDEAPPSIPRLSDLLVGKIDHSLIKTAAKLAREQCKNPASLQEFLTRLVATRIATWDQIKTAVQTHSETLLQQLAQSPGSISQAPHISSDLRYEAEGRGLDWNRLMQALEQGTMAPPPPSPPATSRQTVSIAVQQPRSSSAQTLEQVGSQAKTQQLSSPSGASSTSSIPMGGTTHPTILSVDDSPIAQKMIARALEKTCTVLLANSALDALQLLNQNSQIKLVLLDVNMPGVDGLEFCRAVRSIPKFKTLPIIMLTANEGRVNKIKGQIAGSTLYLNKSMDEDKLQAVVHQYTDSTAVARV